MGLTVPIPFSSLLIQFSATLADSHLKYGHWIIVLTLWSPYPHILFSPDCLVLVLDYCTLEKETAASCSRQHPQGEVCCGRPPRRSSVPFSLAGGALSVFPLGLVVLNGYFQSKILSVLEWLCLG